MNAREYVCPDCLRVVKNLSEHRNTVHLFIDEIKMKEDDKL